MNNIALNPCKVQLIIHLTVSTPKSLLPASDSSQTNTLGSPLNSLSLSLENVRRLKQAILLESDQLKMAPCLTQISRVF
jgi:hypothetical protein